MKKIGALLLLAALGVGAWLWSLEPWPTDSYRFDGVEGPDRPSVVAPPVPLRLDAVGGGTNRLAVLVTDPDADWMGLVRGFKAHGVPAIFTASPSKALRHQVVIAYPSISGKVLPKAAIQALAQHIRGGGTLLTTDLAGGGLEELFGIEGQTPGRQHSLIRWAGSAAGEDAITRFSSDRAEVRIGSLTIAPTTAEVVGRFEDGAPAAVCRRVGGRACILGVDPGSIAQRAMNGRAELFSPGFVNTYQPSMDVLFRWLRDLYVAGEDDPYLIGTAPAGYEGSLILTHDVDSARSVANAAVYAEAIRRAGASATFFIQTKYVRDWNDEIFFDDANLPALKRVAQGMEIGSHSVSHARAFKAFPLGSGDERYPRYQPFVQSRNTVRGGSVFGELRVSKFLLDRLLGGEVRSFRPGYLAYPETLPEALAATGYRYSSTLTANNAQTHLPFQLSLGRSGRGLLPVWEFPVTIEDEKQPRLGDRLEAAVSVIDRIARHGGVAVVLIHPDITGHKLAFERQLIARMRRRLWIVPMGTFGDWWRARDLAEIDYDGQSLQVAAPATLNGLQILFPKRSPASVTLDQIKGRQTVPLALATSRARAAQSR
ncbi:polysaccharide deacetylase family protein [Sphingomonas sp. S1-29]|uniref:polysaccharide deacetylase family protein n=1 Tax=Sphingomonas sp. S1-29 TaxID=2991074 RepID=UPI002240E0C0|nr:polysaccharide deacetylase family protein [Sphingomonas sp. S1-29]UZK69769.1 polysaccharide deacetylase family protein [Sphingomonas sp. S1-29]